MMETPFVPCYQNPRCYFLAASNDDVTVIYCHLHCLVSLRAVALTPCPDYIAQPDGYDKYQTGPLQATDGVLYKRRPRDE